MKLLRYQREGSIEVGALDDRGVVALRDLGFLSMQSIIQGGASALSAIRGYAASASRRTKVDDVRILAPVERPGKYLAIGMNYPQHVKESNRLGVAAPKEQLWFNKQTTCITGPFDDIDPGVTEKLDYEVELGVVIGNAAKNVSADRASGHVFGYLVANDVSARDWQFHSPTFTVGKSFDTHGPIGPWIVTADEIMDPHVLSLRCFVNGELRQNSETSQMIHNIWQQIAYLSTAFTLEPGDLIATGTPEGVGIASQPPRFLQPGDIVRCEIDGIGHIENRVATRKAHQGGKGH